MAKLTAQEYVDKQARNLKNSTEDIRRGISRVTEAPGASAIRKQDKMLNNVTDAINSGLWAKKTAAVSVQDWKDAAINKGVNRIASGIDAAKQKNLPKAERLLAAVDSAAGAANALPSDTLDDSIRRMETFVRRMHDSKGSI